MSSYVQRAATTPTQTATNNRSSRANASAAASASCRTLWSTIASSFVGSRWLLPSFPVNQTSIRLQNRPGGLRYPLSAGRPSFAPNSGDTKGEPGGRTLHFSGSRDACPPSHLLPPPPLVGEGPGERWFSRSRFGPRPAGAPQPIPLPLSKQALVYLAARLPPLSDPQESENYETNPILFLSPLSVRRRGVGVRSSSPLPVCGEGLGEGFPRRGRRDERAAIGD